MKLAHYALDGMTKVGVVDEGRIIDVNDGATKLGLSGFMQSASIDSILEQGLIDELRQVESKIASLGGGYRLESVGLLTPIIKPEKILLVAVNYHSHGREQNVKPPSEPYFFTKMGNALIGPDQPVLVLRVSHEADWEVELAVIIGKTGKYISRKEALNYVAGYTVSNDISFRDFQFWKKSPEKLSNLGLDWVKGKSLDSSFPLGPWLVTRDQISDPHNLAISLSVNGVTSSVPTLPILSSR